MGTSRYFLVGVVGVFLWAVTCVLAVPPSLEMKFTIPSNEVDSNIPKSGTFETSATCLTNLSVSLGSFLSTNTRTLGQSLCVNAIGEECISVEFTGTTTELVSVTQASVIPGVKEPQVVQTVLSLHAYEVQTTNRSKALASIINSARYASALSPYVIQKVMVGSATVYDRPPDPILSYIGNTSQCLTHFWYLVFFITVIPVLAFASQYCYKLGRKDGRKSFDLVAEQLLHNSALGSMPLTSNTLNSSAALVAQRLGYAPPNPATVPITTTPQHTPQQLQEQLLLLQQQQQQYQQQQEAVGAQRQLFVSANSTPLFLLVFFTLDRFFSLSLSHNDERSTSKNIMGSEMGSSSCTFFICISLRPYEGSTTFIRLTFLSGACLHYTFAPRGAYTPYTCISFFKYVARMPGVVTLGNQIKSLRVEGGTIKISATESLGAGVSIVSSAAGPSETVYYVTFNAPTEVWLYSMPQHSSQKIIDLPKPAQKLMFVRDRLYALSQDGLTFMVVDLLPPCAEVIPISGPPAVDFQPADHGFVFVAKDGALTAFHFNEGYCRVGGGASLIGTVHRLAVVQQDGKVRGVSECGDLYPVDDVLPALLERDQSFVELDNTIIVVDHKTRALKLASGNVLVQIPGSSSDADRIAVSASEETDETEKLCPLCFCEMEEGGVTLDCGHSFHVDCAEMWVKNWEAFKEKGNHIVFTNAYCPSGCKHLIRHMSIPFSERIAELYSTVAQSCAALRSVYPDKTSDDLLHYLCSRCGKPFFGGEKVCFRMMPAEPAKSPDDLICDECADFCCVDHGKQMCVYKCRYCCNPATQRSFGNRYICDRCNQRWEKAEPDNIPCDAAQCPFGGHHPATADAPRAVGCLACFVRDNAFDVSKVIPAEERLVEPAALIGSLKFQNDETLGRQRGQRIPAPLKPFPHHGVADGGVSGPNLVVCMLVPSVVVAGCLYFVPGVAEHFLFNFCICLVRCAVLLSRAWLCC
eukprot:gene4334-3148_t